MNDCGIHVIQFERSNQLIRFFASAAESHDLIPVLLAQQMDKQLIFAVAIHGVKHVINGFGDAAGIEKERQALIEASPEFRRGERANPKRAQPSGRSAGCA